MHREAAAHRVDGRADPCDDRGGWGIVKVECAPRLFLILGGLLSGEDFFSFTPKPRPKQKVCTQARTLAWPKRSLGKRL
jgi:hypothetical protein